MQSISTITTEYQNKKSQLTELNFMSYFFRGRTSSSIDHLAHQVFDLIKAQFTFSDDENFITAQQAISLFLADTLQPFILYGESTSKSLRQLFRSIMVTLFEIHQFIIPDTHHSKKMRFNLDSLNNKNLQNSIFHLFTSFFCNQSNLEITGIIHNIAMRVLVDITKKNTIINTPHQLSQFYFNLASVLKAGPLPQCNYHFTDENIKQLTHLIHEKLMQGEFIFKGRKTSGYLLNYSALDASDSEIVQSFSDLLHENSKWNFNPESEAFLKKSDEFIQSCLTNVLAKQSKPNLHYQEKQQQDFIETFSFYLLYNLSEKTIRQFSDDSLENFFTAITENVEKIIQKKLYYSNAQPDQLLLSTTDLDTAISAILILLNQDEGPALALAKTPSAKR
ncbi:MAG: hypothetical protein KIT27_11930 [Legionellales bacterium]|nr:hypothetical protein [Legionellales bacterium]